MQPKKSKTNLLEEEERRDSLLNLKTLTDNVLNPKYKTMSTNINLSLIEKKNYIEEEKSESSEIGKTQFLLQELKEVKYRHLIRLNKLVYDSLSDEESDEVYEITDGFFTAYYDIEEKFIRKLPEISVNYLSGWFLIDLLCAIPFNTIFAITNRKKKYMVTYTELFKLTELFESFRIIKIYKSYLNNELTHFIKKFINKIDYLQKSIEISIFITIVILHVHYLTCVNIFLSNLQYPNWITVQNLQDSTKFDIYIASFYYVFATVTTVGYGDIVSINIYERFYNLILLVVGIGIYSYCVSALSNYVQQVDKKTLDYQEKSDTHVNDKDIENYMTRRATGQFTTFDFNKTHTKAKFNEKPTVINFNDKPITTMTFIKGKGLTIINNDKNDNNLVKTPIQQYVRIIEIRKNEHFGDILMFLNRRSPLCMKVKTKYAELFLLNKTDAVEISMSFPKIWNQIIKKSLFNMEQIERLINKTLKFFYKQNNHYKRNSLYIRNLNQNNEYCKFRLFKFKF